MSRQTVPVRIVPNMRLTIWVVDDHGKGVGLFNPARLIRSAEDGMPQFLALGIHAPSVQPALAQLRLHGTAD